MHDIAFIDADMNATIHSATTWFARTVLFRKELLLHAKRLRVLLKERSASLD